MKRCGLMKLTSVKRRKIILRVEQRRYIINVIKGVAVFFMIWGHCIQFFSGGMFDYFNDFVFKFIYSFHMPLFAAISGYLFYDSLKKRTLLQTIKSKLSGLLWPIMLWCTIKYILDLIIGELRGQFSISLSAWMSEVTGMFLWFLWSILAASICIALVVRILPEQFHWIGFIPSFFAMYLFPNSEMNLYLFPFFLLGYLARSKEKTWKKYWKRIVCVAIMIYVALFPFYRTSSYIYNSGVTIWKSNNGGGNQLIIDVYRYIIGIVGCITIIGLTIMSVNKIQKAERIALWGQESLQIYILQSFALTWMWPMIWIKLVEKLGYNPLTQNIVIYWVITSVLATVILLAISKIVAVLKRIPKVNIFLFGR